MAWLWTLVTADKRHVAIGVLLVALLALSVTYKVHIAIVRHQRDSLQASVDSANAAAKAQAQSAKTVAQQLRPIADRERKINRQAVSGAVGNGCAISGAAYNRLRLQGGGQP